MFEARTLGELDELLADLPAIDLYQLPSAGIRPARRGGSGPRLRADGAVLPALDATWLAWVLGARCSSLGGIAIDRRPRLDPVVLLIIIPWRLGLTSGRGSRTQPATATRTAALYALSGPTTRKTTVVDQGRARQPEPAQRPGHPGGHKLELSGPGEPFEQSDPRPRRGTAVVR